AVLPIELAQFPTAAIFDRIQLLSREHSLTAYDAAYLDLAREAGLPLATIDEDLIRACKRANVPLGEPQPIPSSISQTPAAFLLPTGRSPAHNPRACASWDGPIPTTRRSR